MTSGQSNLVDIAAVKRIEKGGGTAHFQGELDPQNGREIWIWVPTSQIQDNGDGTFTLPEWLAKDKGLI